MRIEAGTIRHVIIRVVAPRSEKMRHSEDKGNLVAASVFLHAISLATKLQRIGFANRDRICNAETSGVSMLEAEWSVKQPRRSTGVLSITEGHAGPPILTTATRYWTCVSASALNVFQQGCKGSRKDKEAPTSEPLLDVN